MEADIDLLARLAEEGLDGGAEAEAFARREVQRHGDFLDAARPSSLAIVLSLAPATLGPAIASLSAEEG
jgi:hypothetical protein